MIEAEPKDIGVICRHGKIRSVMAVSMATFYAGKSSLFRFSPIALGKPAEGSRSMVESVLKDLGFQVTTRVSRRLEDSDFGINYALWCCTKQQQEELQRRAVRLGIEPAGGILMLSEVGGFGKQDIVDPERFIVISQGRLLGGEIVLRCLRVGKFALAKKIFMELQIGESTTVSLDNRVRKLVFLQTSHQIKKYIRPAVANLAKQV